jgi:hypothetical protein
MRRLLRYANLLAIIGTAWMAIIVLTMRLYPAFVRSLSGYHGIFVILALTELIFTFFLLFFFVSFYLYIVRETRQMTSDYASIAAIVGASWMSLVAILHRFPTAWRWVATQASGLIVAVAQVVFTVPFLIFFVVFCRKFKESKYTLRLRIATVVAIVGTAWLLLVSATRISPVIWRWLFEKGVVKVMIITEPVVAISFLLFLIMLYIEPDM